MKTINYTGSSKLISRIVSLLNRKAPLPLDGNGDPDWGSNGQVLSTDGAGSTTWVNQGGGGGGSTVTWTQVQASGTKIAEISINGTPTDVYTPTPPAVIGDLGDVNIATPANGQILKYNSTSQKWENANGGGGGSVAAVDVSYDNTVSGLSATECQSAIDELAARIDIKELPFTETSDASYGLISVDMGSASKKLVNIVIDNPSGSWTGQFAQDGQYAYARLTDWQGNVRLNKTVSGYVYYRD